LAEKSLGKTKPKQEKKEYGNPSKIPTDRY